MPLPFLKTKRKETGIIIPVIKKRNLQDEQQEEPTSPEMHACAQDILSAIENKDASALAMALQSAFEIADSQPHVEGKHISEEDEEAME